MVVRATVWAFFMLLSIRNQRRWYRKVCTSSGMSRKALSIVLETVYRSFFIGAKMYTFRN